jgi:hypothetical protein
VNFGVTDIDYRRIVADLKERLALWKPVENTEPLSKRAQKLDFLLACHCALVRLEKSSTGSRAMRFGHTGTTISSKADDHCNAPPAVLLGIRGTSVLVESCSITTTSKIPDSHGVALQKSKYGASSSMLPTPQVRYW